MELPRPIPQPSFDHRYQLLEPVHGAPVSAPCPPHTPYIRARRSVFEELRPRDGAGANNRHTCEETRQKMDSLRGHTLTTKLSPPISASRSTTWRRFQRHARTRHQYIWARAAPRRAASTVPWCVPAAVRWTHRLAFSKLLRLLFYNPVKQYSTGHNACQTSPFEHVDPAVSTISSP